VIGWATKTKDPGDCAPRGQKSSGLESWTKRNLDPFPLPFQLPTGEQRELFLLRI
jgi:hypothetical protein